VVSPTLIAVPVTIVPAMGLLWLMLYRYEGYFEDARVFFALVAGFFAGILVSYLEVQFAFQWSWVLFVAGYAFLEGGAKTVVLGLARFRKRKDTPYYAAAFGLGFGAMQALAFVGNAVRGAEANGGYQVRPFLGMVCLFLGGILAHGGSTVLVGRGSAQGKLMTGWLQGAAAQAPILAFWYLWPSFGQDNSLVLVPVVGSLAWGAALLAFADLRILARIVPPEIRDMVAKERRREKREKLRGP
jgi:hypothetical protein